MDSYIVITLVDDLVKTKTAYLPSTQKCLTCQKVARMDWTVCVLARMVEINVTQTNIRSACLLETNSVSTMVLIRYCRGMVCIYYSFYQGNYCDVF